MVKSSTVNASSFMVLTAGKVACEQLGAGEVTDAAWASPFPCDLLPTRPLQPGSLLFYLKSVDTTLASYSLTVPGQGCCPCRLCLAWPRRQGLYISVLPHSTPSGDKDFGGVQWGRDYAGVNKLEKLGEERPAYRRAW